MERKYQYAVIVHDGNPSDFGLHTDKEAASGILRKRSKLHLTTSVTRTRSKASHCLI